MTQLAGIGLDDIVRSFIGLLAVSNVLPILPAVHEHTANLPGQEARRYSLRALLGGNLVALGFMLVAPLLFRSLSLTLGDLRVAGGIVLIAYATHDILFSRLRSSRRHVTVDAELGPAIAPLGVPILVGPATLSMVLVLTEVHGPVAVGTAVAANGLLNALVLLAGNRLLSWLGEGSCRAIGKVMSLVLATLGAGMLRAGITAAFGT